MMTRTTDPDALAAALRLMLTESSITKVPVDDLLTRFLGHFPHLDPLSRRRDFFEALRRLESEAFCVFPKNPRAWVNDARPALPAWVKVTRTDVPKVSPRDSARARAWTPPMQFMANLPMLPDLVTAIALDEFIRGHDLASLPWVPAKERSCEIFGSGGEKRLEALRKVGWFVEGGLSLEFFRCYPIPRMPVHANFLQARPGGIIVSENEAGFDSFCRAAQAGVGFSCVVLGEGDAVARVAEFLKRRVREIGTEVIYYVGDVDRAGLRIASDISSNLLRSGVVVKPWLPGYREMLRSISIGADVLSVGALENSLLWLPEPERGLAREVLRADGHVAQELVGWSFLCRHWGLNPLLGAMR
jgi:hypothetical protein